MNTAFHIGASGLRAYQHGIDVIAHNIANIDTYGYKADKTEFRDLIYNRMDVNTNYVNSGGEGNEILTGHGVKLYSLDLLFNQGHFYNTGEKLDFAIQGDGLFAVDRNGRVEYTRNGAFNISVEGDNNFLVTSDGAYVLDGNLNRIEIIYTTNTSGEETKEIDSAALADVIGVFTFSNPYGLQKIDASSFLPTNISGDPILAAEGVDYEIILNSLERSNTSIAQEMSNLIVMQKAYQFSARVVTTADEIEQIVNNLRK